MNWNRTSAHQIWGKFSYMNAVVDDLTNYLGPDPNASGDGGFTKVYQATGGQTWTFTPTMLMDMTFGFWSPESARVRSGLPGRQLRPRCARDSRHQRSGQRCDRAIRGLPAFNTGFSAVGNRDGWNPIFRDERTYSLATNLTKVKGRHDIRGGYLMNFFYLDHWQPETGNPRGQFDFNGAVTALNATAPRPTTSTTSIAAFLLGLHAAKQERPERADDRARMAAHAVHPRPVDAQPAKLTLDLGMRYELYPIMHRADGRGVDRLDLNTLDVLIAGRGGNPTEQRHEDELEQFRAAARRDLPAQREDGDPHRLRHHLQRDAVGARGARRQRLPDHDRDRATRTSIRSASTHRWRRASRRSIAPDQSTRPCPARSRRGRVHAGNRQHRSRLRADLEHRVRAAPARTTSSVDVAYVGAKGTDGYAALDINAPTDARHRQPGPSVTSISDRIIADQFLGRPAEDEVSVAAGRAEQAVHARAAVQGRLHVQQVDERERQRRPRHAELEHAQRALPQLGAGRIRSPAQLPARIRVCSCRGRAGAATTAS